MIIKPYYRIIRPVSIDFFGPCEYALDDRYAIDRSSFLHAYHLIEKDLKKIFHFIDLHENNKMVFSHRIYELYLRTCTEFEANCKAILNANGYTKNGRLDITDYFKISQASKLNEYLVKLSIWNPAPLCLKPFETWSAEEFNPIEWYQSYNKVKHDRNINFECASLENLLLAISGLLVVLVSQFHDYTFFPFHTNPMMHCGEYRTAPDGIFSIKLPESWTSDNFYNFDWNSLKDQTEPFQRFAFN